MKLTAQNIKFIDNYLENSGVEYFDIRVEMTDHVASALEDREGDFYENFQAYMVEHKTELLASYKKYKRAVARKTLKRLFMNAVKPVGLLLLGVMLSLVAMTANFAGEEITFDILEVVYVIMCSLLSAHFYYSILSSKKKFAATWTMISYCYFTVMWGLFFMKPDRILERFSEFGPILYYTVFIYLMVVFYSMFISIRKELVQRYTTLNA